MSTSVADVEIGALIRVVEIDDTEEVEGADGVLVDEDEVVFGADFLDGDGQDGPSSASESISLVSSVRNKFVRRAPGEAVCAVVDDLIAFDLDIAGVFGLKECSGVMGAEQAWDEGTQGDADVDAESVGAEDAGAIGLRGRGL